LTLKSCWILAKTVFELTADQILEIEKKTLGHSTQVIYGSSKGLDELLHPK